MTDPMLLFTAVVAAVTGPFGRHRHHPLDRRDGGAVSIEQVLWYAAAAISVAVVAAIIWSQIRDHREHPGPVAVSALTVPIECGSRPMATADLPGPDPPRRWRGDRGAATSLSVALLTPMFVFLAFAAFQAAMWSHAKTEARVVARDTAALIARSGIPAADAAGIGDARSSRRTPTCATSR